MQQSTTWGKTNKKQRRTNATVIFLALILLVWFISIALSPIWKTKELREALRGDSGFENSTDSCYLLPEMHALLMEKAYNEALITLSNFDSIQCVISLPDSTLSLSYKGVSLFRTRLRAYKKDRLFDKLTTSQLYRLCSRPLAVQKQYATIAKEPIVVRHAPQSAKEAATTIWQPDTLIENPTFVVFSLEYKLRILVEQDKVPNLTKKWGVKTFSGALFWQRLTASAQHFFSFTHQEYIPTLTISLPATELRVIYRALPTQTHIVIHL